MDKRVFISIDLPSRVRNYLTGVKNSGIYWIRWMTPGNFHITLNFLGYLNEDEIVKASEIIREAATNHEAFELELEKFKTERDMLWLLPANSEDLENLQYDLKEKLLEARLVKRERHGYSPHILFAKSKTGRRLAWQPENYEPQKFVVDKVNLYESQLTPGAATHILLASFALMTK